MTKVLFSSTCNEPEGEVTRKVTDFPFTPENLQRLWFRAREFNTLMGIEIKDWQDMLNFFVKEYPNGSFESRGLCVQVDDLVGIFWLTDIEWPKQASIHYTFFDRRHKGREELCKEAIKYVFSTYRFHRVYTTVPIYAKVALQFIERLGFKKEGRLRSNTLFKGQWWDANVYSILETEV